MERDKIRNGKKTKYKRRKATGNEGSGMGCIEWLKQKRGRRKRRMGKEGKEKNPR